MVRKFGLGVGALALAVGISVGAGAAGAAKTPVALSGAVHCSFSGSYIFNPGLTNAGGMESTVTLKGKLTGCTGPGTTNGTVTISRGHFIATSATTILNSYGAVSTGEALPDLTGTIIWRSTGGPVTPTTITMSSQSMSYDSGLDRVSLYGTPSLTAGSFSGQPASNTTPTTPVTPMTANVPGLTLEIKAGFHPVKSIAFGKNPYGPTSPFTFTIGA